MVAVCGPSGGGKSTLLKCINGLERFEEGEIVVDGISVGNRKTNLPKLRSRIGMVFQSFELFPHLRVLDNLNLAQVQVLRRSREAATDTSLKLLDRMGLRTHKHSYPAELSGGQQQSVAIARALCTDPIALLFDEPVSALDPMLTSDVLNVMIVLAQARMTMVVVTNELEFAQRVAHRVLFMDGGQIIANTPTSEFFNAPVGSRVEKFLFKALERRSGGDHTR